MTTEVIDKFGRKVTRSNGILQDGDRMTVPMRMMDGVPHPELSDAVARAESQRRIEAFDKSQGAGHKPGYSTAKPDHAASLSAREARDAKLVDAWKSPASVATQTATAIENVAVVGSNASNEQLFAARDQAIANRDKRLEAAWSSNPEARV